MAAHDECDVCREPGSEHKGFLVITVGIVPDSPNPNSGILHVHRHCIKHVQHPDIPRQPVDPAQLRLAHRPRQEPG